jgi:RHS repeat-associated protein
MRVADLNIAAGAYRFGFNGKENDNEVHSTVGAFQHYGLRMYDPRIGRFICVDPITNQYPWYTPYQFAGNKPIMAIDLDGLEEFSVVDYRDQFGNLYKTEIRLVGESGVLQNQQIVHRSEVRFDGAGNATVNYLGSRSGSSRGQNAFGNSIERTNALGEDGNGNAIKYIIPKPFPVKSKIHDLNTGKKTNKEGLATYYTVGPSVFNNYFTRLYYDANGTSLGSLDPDEAINPITLTKTDAPALYTGSEPSNIADLPYNVNAIPESPFDRGAPPEVFPTITKPGSIGTDGCAIGAQGGDGRTVENDQCDGLN